MRERTDMTGLTKDDTVLGAPVSSARTRGAGAAGRATEILTSLVPLAEALEALLRRRVALLEKVPLAQAEGGVEWDELRSTLESFEALTKEALGVTRTLCRPPGALASSEAATTAAPDTAIARILLVDEDPFLLRGVGRCLSKAHDVDLAAGATEALERLESGRTYDLAIVGMAVPRRGAALVATMKERFSSSVPLVAVIDCGTRPEIPETGPVRVLHLTAMAPTLLDQIAQLLPRPRADGA